MFTYRGKFITDKSGFQGLFLYVSVKAGKVKTVEFFNYLLQSYVKYSKICIVKVKKLISIVMPAKNAAPYLRPCIDSILAQSYQNWELVVVNDSSTDQTSEILWEYSHQNDKIQWLDNQGNGIIDALRTAYAQVNGQFIHRMDADDIMPLNKLKLLVESWTPNSVVTGKVKYFSDEWMVGLGFQNYENWINNLMSADNFWEDVYMECPIPSPGWLMDRDDFDRIGGFNSDYLPEDYDFCFRAYKHGTDVVRVQEVIHHWRDSQNRTSRKLPIYFPMAYYPLKVRRFLDIDFNRTKELVLWGAGKKGKRVASLLNEAGQQFIWITDNPKKQGVTIHDVVLSSPSDINWANKQLILAVSSPEDKAKIQERLDQTSLKKAKDYWWFC